MALPAAEHCVSDSVGVCTQVTITWVHQIRPKARDMRAVIPWSAHFRYFCEKEQISSAVPCRFV